MLVHKRLPFVVILLLGFVYGIAFACLIQDFNIRYLSGGPRPDIGYYYSDAPVTNAWCHRLFWPLSRLLELTGRWVFSADGCPGPAHDEG
jgi:hypothetical protein